MKSETSLVAEQVRLKNWALQIQECQNRPASMSVGDWCNQHNIKKSLYYYRLKRLRESCLEAVKNEPEQEFIELPIPQARNSSSIQGAESVSDHKVAAILRSNNGLSFEIMDNVSASFLHLLIGELQHAK